MKKLMYVVITFASFVLAMASGQALAAKDKSSNGMERVEIVHFKGLADADDEDLVEGIDYLILKVGQSAARSHRAHGDILASELPSNEPPPQDPSTPPADDPTDPALPPNYGESCGLFGNGTIDENGACSLPEGSLSL